MIRRIRVAFRAFWMALKSGAEPNPTPLATLEWAYMVYIYCKGVDHKLSDTTVERVMDWTGCSRVTAAGILTYSKNGFPDMARMFFLYHRDNEKMSKAINEGNYGKEYPKC